MLNVSVAEIVGDGDTGDVERVRLDLMGNAEQALKSAVSDPELRIVKGLEICRGDNCNECATIHAESLDGMTMVRGVVASNSRAVLLGTFEGPNDAESAAVFEGIVRRFALT